MAVPFETYLQQFSETLWLDTVNSLLPDVHGVDRNATQVWFRFYPLEFLRFIEKQSNEADLRRSLGLLGDFDLAEQIDTSHKFLYGHKFWKVVKAAVEAEAEVFTDQMPALSDETLAASKDMKEGDRNAMVRGMVERLATRLKQNGDDVEGWLRLVRAYLVMGDRDKAVGASTDARQAVANDAARLRQLDEGLKTLGLDG
jgi:hemerythrin superfamily protein